ncbi:hypothetical protein Mgra_00002816 [Meloidogyne graminicola]|uniref:Methionine--tRNA ligase, cytoplasmic n=1 Tax=Meloidogyne graminicola TaxID=189291 RepID=A0A8S9ZX46_9BILA|nr:hypothetical protein Mgra_00002816 [Meloidogyne graminicola]
MTTQFQRFSEPNFLQNQQPESIVPIEGRRNILVCAALPYVNNVPHLGNIIGAVLSADVFVRYCRMREYQCLYICGTDEYGTATELRALTEGVSPKEICDKFHKLHKEVYDWFGIAFDCFGRTSSEHQTELVQDMFLKIYNNGFTSLDIQKQLHCSNCDKFLADRFVNGICPHCKFPDARGDQCDKCGKLLDGIELIDPKCLICGNEPLVRETEHIFLNLDQLTSKVQNYLDNVIKSPGSHWSTTAISITRSWMKTGLERRSITRDLKWGIPVPLKQFSSKVFYVWFDAVIGYLSITKSLLGPKWINWWKNPDNVELYNFLGKDNVPFHSIIFPACLAASGEIYTNPRHLCATEYLNYEGQKFSKSRGLGVFGDTVAEIGIPPDVLRFYLICMRPEGQDTSFCWDDLVLKVNSELLANLGNFVNRALSFLSNFFSGIQPSIEISQIEEELFIRIDEDLKEFICAMENVRMRDALHTILSISRRGNQYMQAGKPWVLIKSDKKEDNLRAQTIIGVSANISLFISIMLQPFMPTTSAQIRYQCNIPSPMVLPEHFALFLKTGHKHNKPSPLFTKIETTKVKEWKALYDGDQDFKGCNG